MRKSVLLSLSLLVMTACHSQDRTAKTGAVKSKSVKTPKDNWTVHKRYDKNGNLIEKDSVYSYSYSSANGKQVPQAKMDSLLQGLHNRVHMNFGSMNFPQGFASDSLQNLFFNQHFVGNMQAMQNQMLRQMDSMQRHFFQQKQQARAWIPKEKDEHQPDRAKQNPSGQKI